MAQKFGVLLLHGLTGVPSEMRPVEKYLQKLGFDTEAPTLTGHGASEEEMLDATAAQWIESADQALTRLRERTDSVVLCGLSMGASISAILAARYQGQVSALIMLSPTLNYDQANSTDAGFNFRVCHQGVRDLMHHVVTAMPWLGRLIYWTESPPYGLKDERLQRQITKAVEAAKRGEETKFGLFRTYFISLWNMNLITKEFKKVAAQIRCPVMLISSLEDTLVSLSNATNSYALLGSRDKSMSMLTGCDHVLTLDLQRQYVCRLVGEFMEAVTGIPAATLDESKSGLTCEIHNRLNPLSNVDWARLVPGSQSLPDLAELLQKSNVHESQCHTLVVRFNNEPILMVPMVILTRELRAQVGKVPAILASVFRLLAPSLLRPRVGLFGFSENAWGSAPPCGGADELMKSAWDLVERVTQDFLRSDKCSVSGFVHSEFNSIYAARKHRAIEPGIAQWLAEHSLPATPGSNLPMPSTEPASKKPAT
jgi:carboxylesterase